MHGSGGLGGGCTVKQDRPTIVSAADLDFADFYASEIDGQVRRAYLLLGDASSAHDVVADAFTAVFQRWGQIREPGPYLNRCVLNECRDAARKAEREPPARDTPAVDRGELDEVDEFGDLLLTLPYRQRAAIVLRYYGGYSEAEIAKSLDCKQGTVGPLIHRGIKALRHQLNKEMRA